MLSLLLTALAILGGRQIHVPTARHLQIHLSLVVAIASTAQGQVLSALIHAAHGYIGLELHSVSRLIGGVDDVNLEQEWERCSLAMRDRSPE